MIAKKLKDFLDSYEVKYISVTHSPAYTAHDVAQSIHVPEHEVAKTVVVNIKGELALAVLPASYHIDFHRMMDSLRTRDMYLATEDEFQSRFPDCELGAMPPFGNLYGMKTYVSHSLAEQPRITFNAGDHSEAITMEFTDYNRLVSPVITSFSDRPH